MTQYVIDPYHIATLGVTGPSITFATDGFIVILGEEIVPPEPTPEAEVSKVGGGLDYYYEEKRKKWLEERQKKITATVIIDGKKYVETVYTKDVNMNLKDVKVDVQLNEHAPVIRIILPGDDNV